MDIIDTVHGPRAHVVTSINYWIHYAGTYQLCIYIGYLSMILIRLSYVDPSSPHSVIVSLCILEHVRKVGQSKSWNTFS